jgi:hypothetical protein
MTLKTAIATLSDELGPFDTDELRIIEDVLGRVATDNYNTGWAEGYAQSLEDTDPEFRLEDL